MKPDSPLRLEQHVSSSHFRAIRVAAESRGRYERLAALGCSMASAGALTLALLNLAGPRASGPSLEEPIEILLLPEEGEPSSSVESGVKEIRGKILQKAEAENEEAIERRPPPEPLPESRPESKAQKADSEAVPAKSQESASVPQADRLSHSEGDELALKVAEEAWLSNGAGIEADETGIPDSESPTPSESPSGPDGSAPNERRNAPTLSEIGHYARYSREQFDLSSQRDIYHFDYPHFMARHPGCILSEKAYYRIKKRLEKSLESGRKCIASPSREVVRICNLPIELDCVDCFSF